MTFKVRNGYQGICFDYFSPDADGFQKLPVYCDLNGILPLYPIAHDQGGIDYCVGKAVFYGTGESGDRFFPLSGIQR